MEDAIKAADRFLKLAIDDGLCGIDGFTALRDRLADLITEGRLKAIAKYQKPSREEHEQCWPHGGGNPQLPQ